jgi:DMSO/TMAO reductase YedYZ molybdopterin-dependent catalytic subunit
VSQTGASRSEREAFSRASGTGESFRASRRRFLELASLVAFTPITGALARAQDARLIGTVPLGNPSGLPATPLNRLLGSGLSARLFTDLSTLSPGAADVRTTPVDRFFVRTACPASLPDPASWTLEIAGLVESPSRVSLASLHSLASVSGRYLLECSGNTDPANYGLVSTAEWEGVPIGSLLDRLAPSSPVWRVLVSGVDDDADAMQTSVPGASWIFSRDDLQRALLALRMNGVPLPRDHGFPVRLVVPGWYGCACIKWVNRIELVPDEAPATSQMREFASRTHQPLDASRRSGSSRGSSTADGPGTTPALARDYLPAVIDTTAMPVRVEKWVAAGRVFYRIVGIMWGGARPTNLLSIRCRANTPWTRVEDCPLPSTTDTWSVWTHTWRPAEPGRYDIVLRVDDPAIRTRRLDLFFYARAIQIDQV